MSTLLLIDGQQTGPYTDMQLREMWKAGRVTSETLFWREGMQEWMVLSSIVHELESTETPPALPPRQPKPPKKKSGCLGTVAKVGVGFFVVSVVVALVAPKTPSASPSLSADDKPSSRVSKTRSEPNRADYLSGATIGEEMGKELAGMEGGRPTAKGVELLARSRLEKAKPGSEKEWLKGFSEGFRRGWDSLRGSRNAAAYTELTWDTAKTGTRLYDSKEEHKATVVLPLQDSGSILVLYIKEGSVERKSMQAAKEFWYVRKQAAIAPDLASLKPSEWPRQVSLKATVSFELQGGQGSVSAQPGTRADVIRYSNGSVRVRFGDSERDVPVKDTDFEETVKASFAQKEKMEQQEIERLAAAERAKLEAQEAEKRALRAKIETDAGKEPDDAMARTLVKVHLKKVLNDPDSIKYGDWSDIQYVQFKDGKYAWCITAEYRAKNAYGATVLGKSTGYFRRNQLIAVE